VLPALPARSFVHASPPSALSTLSLHDALPIYHFLVIGVHQESQGHTVSAQGGLNDIGDEALIALLIKVGLILAGGGLVGSDLLRSEEHTSELQSRFDLVCRLLLEKKKAQHA